jgi:hypothetical protein
MGYDQVDAEGQFAPMINPLRGTRGLEGKGRKWHTSTDIDGLMQHLSGLGHGGVSRGIIAFVRVNDIHDDLGNRASLLVTIQA